MTLRFRRGTDSDRSDAVTATEAEWENGEPVWISDTKKLYVGDGSTQGGVLVNPSITLDTTAENDSEAVETVIVERSRSAYEAEDGTVDLRTANNFTIAANSSTTVTFVSDSLANDISDGQSGYIIITAGSGGSASISPSSTAPITFVPTGSNPISVAASETGFISYTVAGSSVYLSAAIVTDS